MTGGERVALDPSSIVRARDEHLSSDLGGETVILNMNAGVYFGLDGVGTRVWQLIATPHPVADLCERLRDEYDVDADRCERAVLALLREMADAGLIEVVGRAEPAA